MIDDDMDQYRARREREHREKVREARLRRSNIPVRLTRNTDELTWPPEVRRITDRWVEMFLDGKIAGADAPANLLGKGLLLDGDPGTGKTTLAGRIGTRILGEADASVLTPVPNGRHYQPVRMDRAGGLLEAIKASWDQDTASDEVRSLVRGLSPVASDGFTITLLIVDDFGKEYRTEWARRLFENLIRDRFDRGLPTIVTTNVPLERWDEVYGVSVGSFAHEAFIHVPMLDFAGQSPVDHRRA